MAWKKPEDPQPATTTPTPVTPQTSTPAPRPAEPVSMGNAAVIGSSLVIKGEVSGNEDVVIHGQIDGKVTLRKNSVVVGREGRVKADIIAKSIRVEGQVNGNLIGDAEVIIHRTGQVRGNITAPQVSLENGSKFKGAIDMEPGDETTGGKQDGKPKEVSSSLSATPTPSPATTGVSSVDTKETAATSVAR